MRLIRTIRAFVMGRKGFCVDENKAPPSLWARRSDSTELQGDVATLQRAMSELRQLKADKDAAVRHGMQMEEQRVETVAQLQRLARHVATLEAKRQFDLETIARLTLENFNLARRLNKSETTMKAHLTPRKN